MSLMINVPVDVASAYIERLFALRAYDISGASDSTLDAFHDAALACADLAAAWDDNEIAVQGINALVRCLADSTAALLAFGRDGGGICRPAVLSPNEFPDSGIYIEGTDLGDDLGTAIFEVGDARDCLLSAFDGAAVVHTVSIFGEAMNPAGDKATTCRGTDFDNDRFDGVFGEKSDAGGLDLGQNALWGYTQLAVGRDPAEVDHHFLTAGIFHFGGKATDASNADIELGSGDFQSVDFGATLPAYHLIDFSNNDGAVPLQVDVDAEWMIFSSSNSIHDNNADGRGDSDSVSFALDDMSDKLLLIQECNSSDSVEFAAADGSSTVVQQLNDNLIVTPEDQPEKRLFASFMLAVVIDTTDAQGARHVNDLKTAAFMGIAANGPVGDYLANQGPGDSLSPLELARMIARSRALCDPAVVGLGAGDDIVVNRLPVAYPNCAVSGLRPQEEFTTSCPNDLSSHRADMFGVASFTCVNSDGTSPADVTVVSGGVANTIAIGP